MGAKTRHPASSRQVAFLRAINVGGHVVRMERLRELFAELGLANVETFIASGNVIFDAVEQDASALERRIAQHLEPRLGYPVATFIRSIPQLAAVVRRPAFAEAEADAHGLYIAFLGQQPGSAEQAALMALRNETDDFEVHDREVHWLRRTRDGNSTFSGAQLERCLALPATVRNITSIRRLLEKHGG